MDQYKDDGTERKIVALHTDNKEQELYTKISELARKVEEQDVTIKRMHRDIVRLREAINQVAARSNPNAR